MKNKIHSLIVEGILFCGSGLGLLSYSLVSYRKSFNKDWAQSPYLFPLIVGAAMTGLSAWLIGEGLTKGKNAGEIEPPKGTVPQAVSGSRIGGVFAALLLCGIYYLALAELKIPYITIGIFSFLYTFSTFEVATIVFLAVMMAFMGVRRLRILLLVPLGTTLFLSIAFRAMLHVLLP